MIATVAVSAIVSALVAWAVARTVATRTHHETGARRPSAVCCTACGATFGTRADAREHARDAHNAPGDPAAVDEVLELVER